MGEYGTLCEIQVTISIAGVRKRGDAAYGLDSCRRPMGVSTSCELTKKEKAIEMYICMCLFSYTHLTLPTIYSV